MSNNSTTCGAMPSSTSAISVRPPTWRVPAQPLSAGTRHRYAPPKLGEQTPAQAQRADPQRRLTQAQIAALPSVLPITAGRVHFIRQVAPDGTIALLNETWHVSRRLAGKYVWATITTHTRRLAIRYQPAAHHNWRQLKSFAYDLPETVARLGPEFAHA
jgi:hypothetical protein